MSRLDEIKNDYKNGFPVDIDYLFQCVEESRKWHKMYEDFSNQDDDTKDRLSKKIYEMQLQNQRYKQGLKFIAHTAEIGLTYQWHAEAFKEKAWEALKEGGCK